MTEDEEDDGKEFLEAIESVRIKWRHGYVPVLWSMVQVDALSQDDYLPPYLATAPRVGDVVETAMGRRLAIKDLTHVAVGNAVFVRCEIGRDMGGTSPTGGGGSAGGDDW